MQLSKSTLTLILSLFIFFGFLQVSTANEFEPKYKIVIQVSSDDTVTQTIALNNAVNLQKDYGLDNIAIEVVAYGPGLGLLTQENSQSARVKSLATQNIRFSACGNTMDKVTEKTGKRPNLTDGVQIVKAGVGRIMELQTEGYAYVRP